MSGLGEIAGERSGSSDGAPDRAHAMRRSIWLLTMSDSLISLPHPARQGRLPEGIPDGGAGAAGPAGGLAHRTRGGSGIPYGHYDPYGECRKAWEFHKKLPRKRSEAGGGCPWKYRGGAPRGERPALLGARRLASVWRVASWHARVRRSAPRLSARCPLVPMRERKMMRSRLPPRWSPPAGTAPHAVWNR